jgi:hypothetical protein
VGEAREGYLITIQKYRNQKTKILNLEKSIEDLLLAKTKTKDPAKREQILTDITLSHRDLQKLYAEFEDLGRELRFRYPEKNESNTRQYQRLRLRSIEQMETELGLDGQLDQLRAKIRSKYKVEPTTPESAVKLPVESPEAKNNFRLVK